MSRSRLALYAALGVFTIGIVVSALVYEAQVEAWREQLYAPEPVPPEPEFYEMYPVRSDQFAQSTHFEADQWIRSVWRACNTGDLSADLDWVAPPATREGGMYMAACLALAGRVDEARRFIGGLDEAGRRTASGILINVHYPAARQGRYLVVGPAMELGLEHWPSFEIAMFYAGMGRLAVGDLEGAREFFVRYLALGTSGSDPERRRAKARELVALNDSVLAARRPGGP